MKKYQIIYADPPWKYGSGGVRSGKYNKLDYKTMTVDDICNLPVNNIVTDDSALFIWATSAFVPHAIKVIEAWGFKYVRIDSIWQKVTVNGKPDATCGPWGMTDAEVLLMGVRGSMASKQTHKRNFNTIVQALVPGHSVKPAVFRQRIEHRFQGVDRLEMFARENPKGWDVFGDECENSIDIFDNEIKDYTDIPDTVTVVGECSFDGKGYDWPYKNRLGHWVWRYSKDTNKDMDSSGMKPPATDVFPVRIAGTWQWCRRKK